MLLESLQKQIFLKRKRTDLIKKPREIFTLLVWLYYSIVWLWKSKIYFDRDKHLYETWSRIVVVVVVNIIMVPIKKARQPSENT